jgi:hypothetical protein
LVEFLVVLLIGWLISLIALPSECISNAQAEPQKENMPMALLFDSIGDQVSEKKLRKINTPDVGWMPISYDFGRDRCWAIIENSEVTLAAAGLYVAVMGLCLSAGSSWISRLEVLRSSIPGSESSKLDAIEALREVGLFMDESQDGLDGWFVDVGDLLAARQERFERAQNAARIRHSKKGKTGGLSQGEESPPVDEPWA